MAQLMPIGRFSKMTRLSVKALRLYDDMGLLTPEVVDEASGYRYYDIAQANTAEAIRVLRSVDMPLDEIRSVIDTNDRDLVHKHLVVHRDRLAERLATHERMLSYLEDLIDQKEGIMPYEIEIMTSEPQLVAATRVHTNLSQIGEDIGTGFGTLVGALGRLQIQPAGAPLIVYHDVIDEETEGDIELCVPVASTIAEDPDVYSRELEGGTMASTVHRGPYHEIGRAYHTVTHWISDHGHEIAGPPRETYLNDPQEVSEEELLTRVDFPINADAE